MQLNCLSFYCSKHFIKLTQQQFPVGPGRHKINVRFESSVLWRYFDVFYFELFCVSVYNHACMHTCMLAHMHTHTNFKEHRMVSQNVNIWLYILTCDTSGSHHLPGLPYLYN